MNLSFRSGSFLKAVLYISGVFLFLSYFFLKHYIDYVELLESWFVFKGLAYYKDFSAYHLPLARLIMVPLHQLTNWDLRISPPVGLFFSLGTLYFIYQIAKKYFSYIASSAALIFFSILYWYYGTQILYFPEQMMGFLLTVSLFIFLKVSTQKSPSYKLIFLLGLFLSLTITSGILTSITIVTLLLIAPCILFTKPNFQKNLGVLVIGASIPATILLIYVLSNNIFWEFIQWNFLYYFYTYSRHNRPSVLDLPWKSLFIFLSPFIALIFYYLLNIKTKKSQLTNLFLLLSSTTLPFILFSVYHPRHLIFALPILSLSLAALIDLPKNTSKKSILALLFTYLMYALLTIISPWYISNLHYNSFNKIFNQPNPGDGMYESIEWIRKNSSGADTIMVFGNSYFYFASDRVPASRPNSGIPYAWEPFSMVKKELNSKLPKYWIIDQEFMKRMLNQYKRPDMVDFLNQQLSTCYKLTSKFKHIHIYQKTCPQTSLPI